MIVTVDGRSVRRRAVARPVRPFSQTPATMKITIVLPILLACFVIQTHPSDAFLIDVQKANDRQRTTCIPRRSICLASSPRRTEAVNEDVQRAAEQLRNMRSGPSPTGRTRRQVDDGGVLLSLEEDGTDDQDAYAAERRELFEELRLKPANDLKAELKSLHLKVSGRKPALAQRLADHYIGKRQCEARADASANNDGRGDEEIGTVPAQQVEDSPLAPVTKFGGLVDLSPAAGTALARAQFAQPSPIQAAAIPALVRGESCILHAETGSGKTLTYLLPITEMLWKEAEIGRTDPLAENTRGFAIILTPTRELAAQVAGVATVLAPPGTVRLISQPTNLLRAGNAAKERGEDQHGGRRADGDVSTYGKGQPRILVGSAKAIMTSLFGNSKMPAPPTSKPEAKKMLENVGYIVMDEVDRLLNVKKSRSEKAYKKHEKPAAVLTSAVTRYTLGKAQIVAASATVGRPLRRELSRVLGLSTQECPPVVRGKSFDGDSDAEGIDDAGKQAKSSRFGDITRGGAANGSSNVPQLGRVVTIPSSVTNYVVPSMGDSSGQLLTTAASIVKNLPLRKLGDGSERHRRVLMVLSKGCELSVRNALGALQHFQCQPEPRALIDVLEADGTDRMIEVHRKVSGATGVGESAVTIASGPLDSDGGDDDASDEGYLYVTGEDSVRGLHLNNLDTVICVGRPRGPDEYTHIAGRTGRAGKKGTVINVVSYEQATALTSWEKMLEVSFYPLDEEEVSGIIV